FRVGGIPEVVRHDQTGVLETFGDTEAIARALQRLADAPELAEAMGRAGKEDATKRFSAAAIVPLYEAIYQRLLSAAAAN
ncbi:MAG TPA: glycosyltransferase, partial [Chthoniobacterales bacterium]|nr:glycosyltransferase [Chthoniobacterales bacterium]